MKESMEAIEFDCPLLGETAHLVRSYTDLPGIGVESVGTLDCREKSRCGIVTQVDELHVEVDWDKCPKYRELHSED